MAGKISMSALRELLAAAGTSQGGKNAQDFSRWAGDGCRSAPNTDPPKAPTSAKPSGATLRCAPPALALRRHNLEGGQLFDADPGQQFGAV
jgi:hypothetical protein